MTFHVRLTMSEVHKKPSRGIIAIGDTVLIEQDGKQSIITSGIQRKYSEISYSLDDKDEQSEDVKMNSETDGKSKGEKKDNILRNAAKTDLITSSRLRSKNANQHNNEEARK